MMMMRIVSMVTSLLSVEGSEGRADMRGLSRRSPRSSVCRRMSTRRDGLSLAPSDGDLIRSAERSRAKRRRVGQICITTALLAGLAYFNAYFASTEPGAAVGFAVD